MKAKNFKEIAGLLLVPCLVLGTGIFSIPNDCAAETSSVPQKQTSNDPSDQPYGDYLKKQKELLIAFEKASDAYAATSAPMVGGAIKIVDDKYAQIIEQILVSTNHNADEKKSLIEYARQERESKKRELGFVNPKKWLDTDFPKDVKSSVWPDSTSVDGFCDRLTYHVDMLLMGTISEDDQVRLVEAASQVMEAKKALIANDAEMPDDYKSACRDYDALIFKFAKAAVEAARNRVEQSKIDFNATPEEVTIKTQAYKKIQQALLVTNPSDPRFDKMGLNVDKQIELVSSLMPEDLLKALKNDARKLKEWKAYRTNAVGSNAGKFMAPANQL